MAIFFSAKCSNLLSSPYCTLPAQIAIANDSSPLINVAPFLFLPFLYYSCSSTVPTKNSWITVGKKNKHLKEQFLGTIFTTL